MIDHAAESTYKNPGIMNSVGFTDRKITVNTTAAIHLNFKISNQMINLQ